MGTVQVYNTLLDSYASPEDEDMDSNGDDTGPEGEAEDKPGEEGNKGLAVRLRV